MEKPTFITDCEDGLLLEWVKPKPDKRRFYIFLGNNEDESSWGYVEFNTNFNEDIDYGHLPKNIIDCLKKYNKGV
jgi:hypothetical protein